MSVPSAAAVLLGLLAAAAAQEPPELPCRPGADGLLCSGGGTSVLVMNVTSAWPEAQAVCRRKDMYLLPSRAALNTVLLRLSREVASVAPFWTAAREVRSGYFDWPYRHEAEYEFGIDYEQIQAHLIDAPPEQAQEKLCGQVMLYRRELELGWAPCSSNRQIVCYSDPQTDRETMPATYQPSITLLANVARTRPLTLEPDPDRDELLYVTPEELDRFNFSITCGDGDVIVKDNFVIGRSQFRSEFWQGNFTIIRQVVPEEEVPLLNVGTFWCRRFVQGAAEPAASGRVTVTTSPNLYRLQAPRNVVGATLRLLISRNASEGSGSSEVGFSTTARPLNDGRNIEDELRAIVDTEGGAEAVGLRYLAIYDASRPIEGRLTSPKQTVTTGVENVGFVSLLVDGDFLSRPDDGATQPLPGAQLRLAVSCKSESTRGLLWQSQSFQRGTQTPRGFNYVRSFPPCLSHGGAAWVQRLCKPSLDRGADWGPYCAAGVCQDSPPDCEPIRCPTGFSLSSRLICYRVEDNVAFDDREAACQQYAGAQAWPSLQGSENDPDLLAEVPSNKSLLLPYRRMWRQGPLWPQVIELFARDEGGPNFRLDLNHNCSVLIGGTVVSSASCQSRHAVLCFSLPQSSPFGRAESALPHDGACPSLGRLALLAPRLNLCFSVLCSSSEADVTWSTTASLCADAGAKLASLTLPSYRDIVADAFQGGTRDLLAVNLTRLDEEVVWGNSIPLMYPALAPDISTAENITQGVLDTQRREYSFVGKNDTSISCAVCDKTLDRDLDPSIFLFYGGLHGTTVFANFTSHIRVSDISCFVSTRQNREVGFRVPVSPVGVNESDTFSFLRVLPAIDFGYLICGSPVAYPSKFVTSNILSLIKGVGGYSTRPDTQEFVIALRPETSFDYEFIPDRTLVGNCDPTTCLSTCFCFRRRLNFLDQSQTSYLLEIELHPMRAIQSENGSVTELYFATVGRSNAHRRRRQVEQSIREQQGPQQEEGPVEELGPQLKQETLDGVSLLRDRFGADLEYVHHARCCPPERTTSPVPLHWPRTCADVANGATVPIELCLDDEGRSALRHCRGSPLTGVQWGHVEFSGSACSAASATSVSLHQLSQTNVTEITALNISIQLMRLMDQPIKLVSHDVLSVAVTLENVQRALRRAPSEPSNFDLLQRNVVTSVSQLMDVDQSAISSASASVQAGPRAVRALEGILASQPTRADINTENVGVRAGDIVGVTSTAPDLGVQSLRTLRPGSGVGSVFGVEVGLLLLNKEAGSSVVFVVFRHGGLLQSGGQRVTSQVVNAFLPSQPEEEPLHKDVLITFRSLPGACAAVPTCAFWDVSEARWSTRGCWRERARNGSDVCRCNHLTNFARIFNYERDVYLSPTEHKVLDVITYVGCALSLTGLALTMLTFCLFRQWRRLRGSQIVMHLSVALTGVYVSFLAGLAATGKHVTCICFSALLHYFLLAAFGWMAVEAVFQYLRFVRVVGTYIPGFMRKAAAVAWGGPLLPVVALLASRRHCYDGQIDVCWMDYQSFTYALALPALVIIVFNVVIFGLVVYALSCGRQKGLRTNQSERQLALRRLRVGLLIFTLLGLPWLFAFLAVRQARLVFSVLFCVFSMMQGFAIFLLMVAGESGVRDLWRGLLTGQCCSAVPSASNTASGPTSSTALAPSSESQDNRKGQNKTTRF